MGVSGFLSILEVERFLSSARSEVRDLVLELRNIVDSVCPSATERILWGGLSYHDSAKGGPVKGAICQIELAGDHVRLSFVHGVRLRDPESLLRGDRLSKRYLPIASYKLAPWDAIRNLIKEAANLDPSNFGSLPPFI